MSTRLVGRRPSRVLSGSLVALLVACVSAAVTAGGGRPPVSMPAMAAESPGAAACAALMRLSLPDTVISSAVMVPAKGEMPGYCKVIGGIERVILFEIDLPTTVWNGKFF